MYFSDDLVRIMSISTSRSDYNLYYTNAVSLTRLLFPFLGVVILSSVIMGVLHEKGRFFITSISPIIFNLGFILGALCLGGVVDSFRDIIKLNQLVDSKLFGLGIGVMIGGTLQMLFQFYFCD